MTVDVNEPWAHVTTRCVVCFTGCDVTICADPYDYAVFYQNISLDRWSAGTVDHLTVSDDQVYHGRMFTVRVVGRWRAADLGRAPLH